MRIHLVMLSVGVMLGSTLLAGVALADQHPAEGRNVTAFAPDVMRIVAHRGRTV